MQCKSTMQTTSGNTSCFINHILASSGQFIDRKFNKCGRKLATLHQKRHKYHSFSLILVTSLLVEFLKVEYFDSFLHENPRGIKCLSHGLHFVSRFQREENMEKLQSIHRLWVEFAAIAANEPQPDNIYSYAVVQLMLTLVLTTTLTCSNWTAKRSLRD